MHVHRNQFDPNLQLSYLGATAKAEAKKAAERTRKKLLEAASSLAGESGDEEGYVVHFGGRGGSQEDESQPDREGQPEKQQVSGNRTQVLSGYA